VYDIVWGGRTGRGLQNKVHGVTLIKSGVRKVKKEKKHRGEDRYMQNRFCGVLKSRDWRHDLTQGFMKS